MLTEPGQALAEAISLARRICENGPMAVQTAKSIVNKGLNFSTEEMFRLQAPLMQHIFESQDAREGSLAFAEKRKPVWQNK